MKLIDIGGWYGAIAIVFAYVLVSFDVVGSDSAIYQLLNFTGALGIVFVSWKKRALQPAALNAVWTLIAAIALLRMVL